MDARRPLIVAHRGASAEAPENTLAAFRRAIELRSDLIELDIRFTADKRIVAIHDHTVRRTTGSRGAVAEMTLEALRRLDAGSWFQRQFKNERIPTLEEVCKLVRPTTLGLLVELKAEKGLPDDFAPLIIRALSQEKMLGRSILQSFDHKAVRQLRQTDADVQLAALFDSRTPAPVAEAIAAGGNSIALKWKMLTPSIVHEARAQGLRTFVWTVDRNRDIARMIAMGADAIITNYPDRGVLLRDGRQLRNSLDPA